MEDTMINLGFTLVLDAIKNPAKKAKFRAVILKAFKAIKIAFAGDVDFA